MTNAEAIEILQKEGCGDCTWGAKNPSDCDNKWCEVKKALNLAISALERDRWISVEERLPEDGKNVLCRIAKECMYYDDAGGEVFVMDAFIIEGHYRKGKHKGWYRAVAPDIGRYTNNVTHWRPLPEPPKEET